MKSQIFQQAKKLHLGIKMLHRNKIGEKKTLIRLRYFPI